VSECPHHSELGCAGVVCPDPQTGRPPCETNNPPVKGDTWAHRQYTGTRVVIIEVTESEVRFRALREGAVPVRSFTPIFLEHYERVPE
jgi:hypothetical protein